MKPGYATMLRVLGTELDAAIALATAAPTRTNAYRVKLIRGEIKRVRRGRL